MFFVEITNFLPTILLYHLTSSLQADNVANIYAIFLRFLLKVLKIDIKSPLVSRISVFFLLNWYVFPKIPSVRIFAVFPAIFQLLPPPRIKFDHFYSPFILLYRLFLFFVLRVRLNVYFYLFYSFFCFFCKFFSFYYANVFSYFSVRYDLFLSNPTYF